MALDEYSSFRRPCSVPFKWELQPGIPKQPTAAASPSPLSSLQLPPRLVLPPAASSRVSNGSANTLASTTSSSGRRSCSAASTAPLSPSSWLSSSSTQQHRRSMSARFATSLALPFTRPGRRGRSKDEADVAFAVLYGDRIV